jgi:2-succinyl-5-enolpyruvyl-6-hydroxy-3-cyclohexene-1-carboxylate synthase
MIPSSVIQAVQICACLGIRQVVISPGSRSAPLTIAFNRHPDIETYTLSDERSAAFVALGMVRQGREMVALVCTSGSAAYNYAPAIAEAYFQQLPLLVFTADRPPEWIDQLDGQTIRQQGIYGQHIKKSYELPIGQGEADDWFAGRQIAEAIHCGNTCPLGPVHVNVPLREPFYPAAGQEVSFETLPKVITEERPSYKELSLSGSMLEEWLAADRKLIVCGQYPADAEVAAALQNLSAQSGVPVVADVISNMHVMNSIRHADLIPYLRDEDLATGLQPGLLMTFGLSVMSKNLKLFLRKYRPAAHWHIQPAGNAADTFQALSRVIRAEPAPLLRQLSLHSVQKQAQEKYFQKWQRADSTGAAYLDHFFAQQPVGEFRAVWSVMRSLPGRSVLHLANSMAVRYANIIGLRQEQAGIEVIANRGTSGIDGSNSTAVGAALRSPRTQVLVTGDLAFFYDRNAFWHNYRLPNLKIILLNNGGGGIFKMIDGPARQPELETFFVTRQQLKAENTARDFGMSYQQLKLEDEEDVMALNALLPEFMNASREHAAILEIMSSTDTNTAVFNNYRQGILPFFKSQQHL